MTTTKLLQRIGATVPLEMIYPEGSNIIECFGYDAARAELFVKIIDNALYRYKNVPPSMGNAMKAAASAGQFFLKAIRDYYIYERLGPGAYRIVDSLHVQPKQPAQPGPVVKLTPIHTFTIDWPDCWL